MPDRPSDRRDFDWLYGKNRDSAGEDADHTRVLPTMDRDPARDAPRDEPRRRGGGDAPPPRQVAPTPGEGRSRRRFRLGPGKIVLLVVLLYVVFLIAVPFWAMQKLDTVDIEHAGERPGDQPGTTYLVVGSDSRKGLSEEDNKRLGTGGVGDVGQRTDTIMVLHVGSGPNVLLSIPRDSIVPIADRGTSKINAAFAFGGPKLLVRTVEETTGLRIDNYVEIGFGGFVNAVDAVGGVEICPKKAMKDPKANLDIQKGCQEADGVTALGYSRSRHTSGLGDIDRAAHQREVVSGIGAKVKSPWTVLNPVRYYNLNMAMANSIKVSEGTGPVDLGRFAWAMTKVNGEDGLTCGMPIADLAVNWDKERALALLKYLKEDRADEIPDDLCTESGMKE